MLSFCTQTITNFAGSERCTLIVEGLNQTMLAIGLQHFQNRGIN